MSIIDKAKIKKVETQLAEMVNARYNVNPPVTTGNEEEITAGKLIISDGESLIYATTSGNGKPYIKKYLQEVGMKSRTSGTGTPNILCRRFDIGAYPYAADIFDTIANEGHIEESLLYIDGKPTGILEYVFERDTKCIMLETFTSNNVVCIGIDKRNANDFKITFKLENTNYNQNVEASVILQNGKYVVRGYDSASKYHVAMTGVGINVYDVSITKIDVVNLAPANYPKTVTGTDVWLGAGYDGVANVSDKLFFFISIAETQAEAVNNVCNADYYAMRNNHVNQWKNFWNNTRFDKMKDLSLYNKSLMSLQQLYSQSCNGYLTAGAPNWMENYLRDTGWVIKGVSKYNPTFAKSMINWLCQWNSSWTVNSYAITGEPVVNYHNTDSAPTLLIGITEYYKQTGDITTLANNKVYIDGLLRYCKDNLVGNHITSKHPHDFWDDYTPQEDPTDSIDTSLVKFESMIDVLWAYALQEMIPVYNMLNDDVNLTYCTSTSLALKLGVEDYRLSDGSLSYAIKTNDSLYAEIIATPATLYMAWLFNDVGCKEFLNVNKKLTTFGTNSPSMLYHHYKAKFKTDCWFPYVPIAIKVLEDEIGKDILLNSFNLGTLPEYTAMSKNKIIYGHHAPSFPWSHASLLELASK